MPRQARIDAPGALHHIICRGIERRNILKDNIDRNRFLERLGSVLQKTSTPCYGWALIPNHFHLLLNPIRAGIVKDLKSLDRYIKRDGVEFRRFFFHLFVGMKSHATSSQNRYAGCLASYHMQGYRATKHF